MASDGTPSNQQEYQQPTETMQTVLARSIWTNRGRLAVGAVVALLVLIAAIVFCGGSSPPPELEPEAEISPDDSVVPTSTPEPIVIIATPTPAPPKPLIEVVPVNQQGYAEYRFYHFWEEYHRCQLDYAAFEETRLAAEAAANSPPAPAATLTPQPMATPRPPDVEMEQAVLRDLPTEVRWLLARYEADECDEAPQFTGMPGRVKWLIWAAGYSGGQEGGSAGP